MVLSINLTSKVRYCINAPYFFVLKQVILEEQLSIAINLHYSVTIH